MDVAAFNPSAELLDDPTAHDSIADPLLWRRMATCPECDAEIEIDEFDVDKGDQLSCPECGSNLEVSGVSPVELDLSPEDDDDDLDDELDDEDDDEDDEDDEEVDEDEDEEDK